MTANWKITLAILTANTVLMSASYTMLIPFLPMYLIQELGVAQGAAVHLDALEAAQSSR
ncbi:hypothetical protein [Duodenibacillus massiliensis]|uniref:hypothetical protein n=1 Tax=Duodenibacillus massiliensis TaxID=1852381 RepID=UPI0030780310